MKHISSDFRNHIAKYALIFILVFGTLIRFYKLPFEMQFTTDYARDILVAEHMSDFRFVLARPFASGGNGLILNSPLYYWVLSLFWTIGRTMTGFFIVWVGISIAIIWFGYLIGFKLNGKIAGLSTALLISVTPDLIKYAHAAWQPHLLPFITVVNILLLLQTIASKEPKLLFLLINCLFVGLHIHWAYFPIFIVSSFWGLWLWAKMLKAHPIYSCVNAAAYLTHSLVLMIATSTRIFTDQIELLSKILSCNKLHACSINDVIGRYVADPMQQYLGTYGSYIDTRWFVLVLLLIFTFGFLDVAKRKGVTALLVATLMGSIVLTAASHLTIKQPWYFSPYLIVIPITITYLVARLTKNIVYRLFVIFIIAYMLFSDNQYLLYSSGPGDYQLTRQIANEIYSDYQKIGNPIHPKFIVEWIAINGWQFKWDSAPVWYHLEELFKTRLVSIVESEKTIEPLVSVPDYYYVICDNYLYDTSNNQKIIYDKCLVSFINRYKPLTNIEPIVLKEILPHSLYLIRLTSK